MAHDPEQNKDRKLTVIWSQDPMWRRTAVERWFARNRRFLANAAFLIVAGGCVVLRSYPAQVSCQAAPM